MCMVSPSVSNDAAKDKFPKGFEARPSVCRGHTRLDQTRQPAGCARHSAALRAAPRATDGGNKGGFGDHWAASMAVWRDHAAKLESAPQRPNSAVSVAPRGQKSVLHQGLRTAVVPRVRWWTSRRARATCA